MNELWKLIFINGETENEIKSALSVAMIDDRWTIYRDIIRNWNKDVPHQNEDIEIDGDFIRGVLIRSSTKFIYTKKNLYWRAITCNFFHEKEYSTISALEAFDIYNDLDPLFEALEYGSYKNTT